jgi:hypothetical protein
MIRIVLTLVVLFFAARFLLQFGIDTAWSAFEAIAGFFLLCWIIPKLIRLFVKAPQRDRGAPPYAPPANHPPMVPPPPAFCPRCGDDWVPGAQRCSNCG